MKNKPIGIFDSGIGGLTVYSQLIQELPNEKFIYYGDTKNVPYGTKTKEELIQITTNTLNFFKSKDVKAVIMACNTTSAVTYDILKDKFDFTLYPLIQSSISSICNMDFDKIAVLSTEATANSHSYKNEILKYKKNCEVIEHGCTGEWIKIVENQIELENLDIIEKHLNAVLKYNPQKIILGCTHYPYLMKYFKQITNENIFINPAKYFAKHIKKDMEEKNLVNSYHERQEEFYVTSNPELFKNSAKIFYELKENPILI